MVRQPLAKLFLLPVDRRPLDVVMLSSPSRPEFYVSYSRYRFSYHGCSKHQSWSIADATHTVKK